MLERGRKASLSSGRLEYRKLRDLNHSSGHVEVRTKNTENKQLLVWPGSRGYVGCSLDCDEDESVEMTIFFR